jgi:septal ring factor EnvC (AmiA/AmiB activator)
MSDENTEMKEQPKTDRQLITEIDEQIDELNCQINAARNGVTRLARRRLILQRKINGGNTPTADTQSRISYIKDQHRIRSERMAVGRKMMDLVGTTSMDPRSPIDSAMSRNTKRGSKRPVRPAPVKKE